MPERWVALVGGLALGLLGGCGVGQSEECQRYLACQAYYDTLFDRQPPNTNVYQPDGVCWENQELAEECTEACVARTEDLLERLDEEDEDEGDCG